MGQLNQGCNQLRLLATFSIMIKENHTNYIKCSHDSNCDYICLETSSKRKQNPSW